MLGVKLFIYSQEESDLENKKEFFFKNTSFWNQALLELWRGVVDIFRVLRQCWAIMRNQRFFYLQN